MKAHNFVFHEKKKKKGNEESRGLSKAVKVDMAAIVS